MHLKFPFARGGHGESQAAAALRSARFAPLMTLLATFVLADAPGMAAEASFDCARASTQIENLICSSPDLADLDGQLGAALRDARARGPRTSQAILAGQLRWLGKRDAFCPPGQSDAGDCMSDLYRKRLEELIASIDCADAIAAHDRSNSEAAMNDTRPAALAACAAELTGFPAAKKLVTPLLAKCAKLNESTGAGDTGPHLADSCRVEAYRFVLRFEE